MPVCHRYHIIAECCRGKDDELEHTGAEADRVVDTSGPSLSVGNDIGCCWGLAGHGYTSALSNLE